MPIQDRVVLKQYWVADIQIVLISKNPRLKFQIILHQKYVKLLSNTKFNTFWGILYLQSLGDSSFALSGIFCYQN